MKTKEFKERMEQFTAYCSKTFSYWESSENESYLKDSYKNGESQQYNQNNIIDYSGYIQDFLNCYFKRQVNTYMQAIVVKESINHTLNEQETMKELSRRLAIKYMLNNESRFQSYLTENGIFNIDLETYQYIFRAFHFTLM